MVDTFKAAYARSRLLKVAILLVLVVAACLLVVLAGGFPPWAWRFLFQTLPQMSLLWQQQGSAILPALFGLCLLALSSLLLWIIIVTLFLRVSYHLWRDYRSQQQLAAELRVAEILAEHDFKQQEEAEQQLRQRGPAAPTSANVQRSGPRRTLPLATPAEASPARERRIVPPRPIYAPPAQMSQMFPAQSMTQPATQPANYPVRRVAGSVTNSVTDSFPGLTYPSPVPPRTTQSHPAAPVTARGERSTTPHPAQSERESKTGSFGRTVVPPPPITQTTLHVVPPVPLDNADRGAPTNRTRTEEDADQDIYDVPTNRTRTEEEDAFDDEELAIMGRSDSHLRLVVGIGLDPGIVRKNSPNEDSLFVIQGERITDSGAKPAGLFVVADGMGGHVNGREASRGAIRAVSDTIVPTLLRDVSSGNSKHENATLFIDMLKEGIHHANLALFQKNRTLEAGMMGTTVTSAIVVDSTAYVANVGDSRTYRYRPGKGVQQITRDHSVVARLLENGLITRDEVYTHPRRNQIYRCLGEHASVDVDIFIVPVQPDDVLLLCSDGLWEMVHDQKFEHLVAASARSPGILCTQLVQEALRAGGVDNISVIAVRIAPQAARRTLSLSSVETE